MSEASQAPDGANLDTPGHTAPEGEGGGSMSGRGQEEAGEPRAGEPPHIQPSTDAEGSSGGPEGLATPLQPGGLIPGGGPGASQGSLGTGGGSTAGQDSGAVKRDGI
jgi:hypothetical protein